MRASQPAAGAEQANGWGLEKRSRSEVREESQFCRKPCCSVLLAGKNSSCVVTCTCCAGVPFRAAGWGWE